MLGRFDTDPYFDAADDALSRARGMPCPRKVEGRRCYHDACLCDLETDGGSDD